MKVMITFLRKHLAAWKLRKEKGRLYTPLHERRQEKRRYPLFYVPVYERLSQTLLGHVYDITQQGCMLLSSGKMKKGRAYDVSMMLPKNLGVREGLSVAARCMWTKKDGNPEFYVSGFHFETIDDLAQNSIQLMTQEYCFQD